MVKKVCTASYSALFTQVWGDDACSDVATAYDYIAYSIAAYEASPEVSAFSSKFDYVKDGQAKLSTEEQRGFALFRGKGMCHRCHASNGLDPLFTDYTFDNLCLPKNPENPVYFRDPLFIDAGLGGFLRGSGYPEAVYGAEWGKNKVPTLRNVDLRPSPARRRCSPSSSPATSSVSSSSGAMWA